MSKVRFGLILHANFKNLKKIVPVYETFQEYSFWHDLHLFNNIAGQILNSVRAIEVYSK